MNLQKCEYAIRVNDLCKSFGDFQLKDISFTLPRGTIMGLIGENGAGKSTTIKLLLSLIYKDSGSIRIFDRDVDPQDTDLHRHIGVVLDEGFFYEDLTPLQMEQVLRRIQPGWDSDWFHQLLDRFRLPAKKCSKDMSKGMRAKLRLALAMAHRPKLLLLDEPTSGLDPVARAEFLDLLQDFIQDEDCSVLISSHITSDLEQVADYITYIHQGRLLFSAETADLLERYAICRCSFGDFRMLKPSEYVNYRRGAYSCDVLIADRQGFAAAHPDAVLDPVTLDAIMTLCAQTH